MHQADRESITVGIVEDEADLANLYRDYLAEDFNIEIASTYEAVFEMVDDTFDVLLLDRKLPEKRGRDVLNELREQGYTMPVAMVTGVPPDDDIVDMPFDEYLVKPVDRETLLQTVRRLANRRSFEEKSQQFFRLAAKKSSLANESIDDADDNTEVEEISRQMAALRSELTTSIDTHLENLPVAERQDPDQKEIQTLLENIAGHSLPETIEKLVLEYQDLEYSRPPFMWKWVHRLAPYNTLPCVDDEFRDKVPIDKTLLILFITLLDDTLEKGGDRETFVQLSKVPFEHHTEEPPANKTKRKYLTFAQQVWETIETRIERSPKYEEYEDLLRFDIRQAISAIEYSNIAIQRPDLATLEDLERYESHNMVMFAYANIDLMHSSRDVRQEFSTLREVVWTAQLMARIGNWVSTWKREFREGDFSAGPILYAVEHDVITHDELAKIQEGDSELEDELVDRIESRGIEKIFLTRWENLYHQLKEYNVEFSSFDLEPFIRGTEEVLRYHLASTGLK